MPQIDNPDGGLTAEIAALWKAINNIRTASSQQPSKLTVGSGGLVSVGPTDLQGGLGVEGTATLNGGIAGPLSVTGAVTATGRVSGASVGGIQPADVPGIDASKLVSGTVTTPVSTSGAVAGATGTFNGGLNSTSVYSTAITGTRTATWTQNNGVMGTASSSAATKTNIVDSLLSSPARAQAALDLAIVHYNYIAEVAKRDDPTSPDYVGPSYHVHTELGLTAEAVHAAGIWELVVYQRDDVRAPLLDDDGNPVLDDDGNPVTVVVGDELTLTADGNPIPISLHYELFGVVALAAAQYLNRQLTALTARVAALENPEVTS
ncbi:hypothetical protein [Curtobacterium oceanosedimentum]|uniref:hypothetical protein n=1 Tax=Curtobacterium oceanosedimentum TaxID=465820 RepID=UPI0033929DC7